MTIINIQKNEALDTLAEINNISDRLTQDLDKLELDKTGKMIVAYRTTYDLFWANPIAICEEAGNQAYLLFTKHVEMGQAIVARQPDFEELTVPAGWEVVINQDGTVSLTYTEPTPEPEPAPNPEE